jgi:hypothetical protein
LAYEWPEIWRETILFRKKFFDLFKEVVWLTGLVERSNEPKPNQPINILQHKKVFFFCNKAKKLPISIWCQRNEKKFLHSFPANKDKNENHTFHQIQLTWSAISTETTTIAVMQLFFVKFKLKYLSFNCEERNKFSEAKKNQGRWLILKFISSFLFFPKIKPTAKKLHCCLAEPLI